MVDGEEQWLKLRGRWHDWGVGLDVTTALAVLAALLPSRRPWAGRGLGWQRRRLKKGPRVSIPEGLQASPSLVPRAKHGRCRLHHQQGVTHGFKPHFATAAESNMRKPALKQLFRTQDKRPVRRRLARLQEQAPALGILAGITGVQEKRPQLIGRVGRTRLPAPTHAIERFFRAFLRFDATRGGVPGVRSATRELRLFLVVDLVTPRATDGQTPIEVILPEARGMPLYRWINDPFRVLQERESVKSEATMADVLLPEAATA